jgi:hypothetical protein
MRLIVGEPVGEDFIFVRIARSQHREQPGVQVRQRVDVFVVDFLDPLSILLRMSDIANADEHEVDPQKRHSPGELAMLAARPGMWDQLYEATTASQRTLRSMLHRQRSWRQQPNQRRQRQPNPQQAQWPEEESCQQPGQEPRSCCRRHSARMQRQRRLKQVWSSSINTPEIVRIKSLGRECCFGPSPKCPRGF